MMDFATRCFSSPVGTLAIFEVDGGVCALEWGRPPEDVPSIFLDNIVSQLQEYFDHGRESFDIKFKVAGTSFQKKVWTALQKIPYGQVISYGDFAKQLNSSPRAIGMACATNPVPILIPCHRVIASNGQLKGYSGDGGLETKGFLLRLEGHTVENDRVIP